MHIEITQQAPGIAIRGVRSALLGNGNRERSTGPWAAWNWDGNTLTAEVDPIGAHPLYYARSDTGISLSNSIRELIESGVPPILDDDAISTFLLLGYFIGEDTPFKTVRAFPPGGKLTWSNGVHTVKSNRPVYQPSSTLGRDQAIDEFNDRLAYAVRESLPQEGSRSALPLSGGRDSRQILLELVKAGFVPDEIISQKLYPTRGDDDAAVAKELCAALNLPITILEQSVNPFYDDERRNHLFECMSDEHSWFLATADHINGEGFQHCFDGFGPGYLVKGKLHRYGWKQGAKKSENKERLFNHLRANAQLIAPVLSTLLSKDRQLKWNTERALNHVMKCFEQYENEDESIFSFMFWNKGRREISSLMPVLLPRARILTPYVHPDVLTFVLSLPYSLYSDRTFHDEAISRAFPPLGEIRFSRDFRSKDADLHHARIFRGILRNPRYWVSSGDISKTRIIPRIIRACFDSRFAGRSAWLSQRLMWLRSLKELAGGETSAVQGRSRHEGV